MMSFEELAIVWSGITEFYKKVRDGSNLPADTIADAVSEFGYDAVAETLATVIRLKPWDGRIWPSNREWADSIAVNPQAILCSPKNRFLCGAFCVGEKFVRADVDAIHMAHVNQLASAIRECKEEKND